MLLLSPQFHAIHPACSSLQGPFCQVVNSVSPPKYAPVLGATAQESSLQNLVNIFSQTIKSLDGKLKPLTETDGSFKFSGEYSEKNREIRLVPTSWVKQPGIDWIMIGLAALLSEEDSSHVSSYTLAGKILDDQGNPISRCSELEAVRMGSHQPDASWKDVLQGSYWTGKYSCGGSSTSMSLNIGDVEKSADGRRGFFSGTFTFKAAKSRFSETLSRNIDVKLTESGCQCVMNLKDKTPVCGNPEGKKKEYCKIVTGTCDTKPSGDDWDYCVDSWKTLLPEIMLFDIAVDENGKLTFTESISEKLGSKSESADIKAITPVEDIPVEDITKELLSSLGIDVNNIEETKQSLEELIEKTVEIYLEDPANFEFDENIYEESKKILDSLGFDEASSVESIKTYLESIGFDPDSLEAAANLDDDDDVYEDDEETEVI